MVPHLRFSFSELSECSFVVAVRCEWLFSTWSCFGVDLFDCRKVYFGRQGKVVECRTVFLGGLGEEVQYGIVRWKCS